MKTKRIRLYSRTSDGLAARLIEPADYPLTFNGRHYSSRQLCALIVNHGPGIVRQACASLDLPPTGDNLAAIAAECMELEPKH